MWKNYKVPGEAGISSSEVDSTDPVFGEHATDASHAKRVNHRSQAYPCQAV